MTDVRTRPTTYALIKGGNDLLYELLMLSSSVALLDEGWPGSDGLWQGKTLYTAVVESSLVHVRNLMAFFSPAATARTPTRSRSTTAPASGTPPVGDLREGLGSDQHRHHAHELAASGARAELAI